MDTARVEDPKDALIASLRARVAQLEQELDTRGRIAQYALEDVYQTCTGIMGGLTSYLDSMQLVNSEIVAGSSLQIRKKSQHRMESTLKEILQKLPSRGKEKEQVGSSADSEKATGPSDKTIPVEKPKVVADQEGTRKEHLRPKTTVESTEVPATRPNVNCSVQNSLKKAITSPITGIPTEPIAFRDSQASRPPSTTSLNPQLSLKRTSDSISSRVTYATDSEKSDSDSDSSDSDAEVVFVAERSEKPIPTAPAAMRITKNTKMATLDYSKFLKPTEPFQTRPLPAVKGLWDAKDDEKLLDLREVQNLSWSAVSDHFPDRTFDVCMKRFVHIKSRQKIASARAKEEEKKNVATTPSEESWNERVYQWTAEHDATLLEMRNVQKANWSKIQYTLSGFSHEACKKRYEELTVAEWQNRPWTNSDDMKLMKLKDEMRLEWPLIAEKFPSRVLAKCKERYLHLSDQRDKRPWTIEEDDRLWWMRYHKLAKWVDISPNMGWRSPDSCKARYKEIKESRVDRQVNREVRNEQKSWTDKDDQTLSNMLRSGESMFRTAEVMDRQVHDCEIRWEQLTVLTMEEEQLLMRLVVGDTLGNQMPWNEVAAHFPNHPEKDFYVAHRKLKKLDRNRLYIRAYTDELRAEADKKMKASWEMDLSQKYGSGWKNNSEACLELKDKETDLEEKRAMRKQRDQERFEARKKRKAVMM